MECVKGRPQPFGVEIRKDHINFAVQVPTGKKCELLLYKKGSMNPKYRFEMPEEKGIGEVRFLALQGLDTEKYEYNFQIDERVWNRSLRERTCRDKEVRSQNGCAEASGTRQICPGCL